MRILKSVMDWIFPRGCLSCNSEIHENSVLCPDCFKDSIFIDFPYCRCCGKPMHLSYSDEFVCNVCQNTDRYFDLCRSLFVYNKTSKKIIMRIKRDANEWVTRSCTALLCKKYLGTFRKADVIVPVPLHVTRLLRRGFNQADIIAKYMSKATGISVNDNILKRIRNTKSQQNKNTEERKENVHNAFAVTSDITGLKILLVDDVITTGATLSECSKVLKEHGASCVYCTTIAST